MRGQGRDEYLNIPPPVLEFRSASLNRHDLREVKELER